MCNFEQGIDCEKAKLNRKLQKLVTSHTTQDQDGWSYVRVQYIENLMNELECDDV